jgi:hypothetical protein
LSLTACTRQSTSSKGIHRRVLLGRQRRRDRDVRLAALRFPLSAALPGLGRDHREESGEHDRLDGILAEAAEVFLGLPRTFSFGFQVGF